MKIQKKHKRPRRSKQNLKDFIKRYIFKRWKSVGNIFRRKKAETPKILPKVYKGNKHQRKYYQKMTKLYGEKRVRRALNINELP